MKTRILLLVIVIISLLSSCGLSVIPNQHWTCYADGRMIYRDTVNFYFRIGNVTELHSNDRTTILHDVKCVQVILDK
jgi:hypothetical protein